MTLKFITNIILDLGKNIHGYISIYSEILHSKFRKLKKQKTICWNTKSKNVFDKLESENGVIRLSQWNVGTLECTRLSQCFLAKF